MAMDRNGKDESNKKGATVPLSECRSVSGDQK